MTKINPAVPNPVVSFTLKNPPYSYLHLSLKTLSAQAQTQLSLDEITTRAYLTSALQQYLGLTGSAISVDILKVEGENVWIRVPREDEVAVTASLSQWNGSKNMAWRIESRGSWLGALVGHAAAGEVWT